MSFKKKYPVFITIQGFASHATNTANKNLANRIETEQKIIKNFTHFGIRTETMGEDVQKINPRANLLWHRYASKSIKIIEQRKIYDIVFFARICKEKGIEDLIKALGIICKKRPKTSLAVIGTGSSEYIDRLNHLAKVNNVSDRITWLGFLPTQDDVHKEASKAILSVLPTYHDIISGTIIESMKLGLPVIAYNTGSIPSVNINEQRIIIVDKFDIQSLSDSIINLLENQELREKLAQKAIIFANQKFGNDKIKEDLINCYNQVISNFHNKREIKT
jgi:glycosyltransferase involved in cell wall biosynthesis